MKYLLDTDHISVFQRRQGREYESFKDRLSQIDKDDVAVSVISLHEQSLGCNKYISRAKTITDVVRGYQMFHQVLSSFAQSQVVPFDLNAATEFANLRAAQIRISTMDLRLAATALTRSMILVTRNSVDFEQVPNLQTEDWLGRKPR